MEEDMEPGAPLVRKVFGRVWVRGRVSEEFV